MAGVVVMYVVIVNERYGPAVLFVATILCVAHHRAAGILWVVIRILLRLCLQKT